MGDTVHLRLAMVGLLLLARAPAARADLPIVVPPEDRDSHALVTLRPWRASLWLTHAGHPHDAATLGTLQVGAGPQLFRLPVRGGSLGWLARWSFRARFQWARTDQDRDWYVGPLTFAMQRPWTFNLGGIVTLAHLQGGVESTLSTPWLHTGDRDLPLAVRAAHVADSELVESGWSLRPLTGHVRADLLACRSIHLEVGGGPELFRSTAELDRATAIGARWHAAAGFSLACVHRRREWLNDVTVALQWRGRMIAVRGDEGGGYADDVTIGLDLDLGDWAFAGFIGPHGDELGTETWKAGVRLQLRSKRTKLP